MKKAITYIRVSTKMQDVARQRMKIQEYCDRNNYEIVQEIVDKVTETLSSGNVGDGKIFIYPVEEAIRIRTGEKGENAL